MRNQLEEKLARFEELEKQLADPSVLGDSSRIASVAREHGSLAKLAGKFRRFKKVIEEIREATAMVSGDDLELRELAQDSLNDLRPERESLWNELLDMTVGGENAARTGRTAG